MFVDNDASSVTSEIEIELDDDWDDESKCNNKNQIRVNYCFTDPVSFVSFDDSPVSFKEAMSNPLVWEPPI